MRSVVLAASAAGMLVCAASAVRAQAAKPEPAKPEPAKSEAAKPESAEAAAAAMERAQRMASNPMRVILQASKIRRRADGDSVPEAPRAVVRAVSTGGAAAATATVAASVTAPAPPRVAAAAAAAAQRPGVLAAAATPASELPPARTPAEVVVEPPAQASLPVPAETAPEPAAAPVAAPTAKSLTAPGGNPGGAPGLAPGLAPGNATAITAPVPSAPVAVAPAAPVQPKLVNMIEPDIPARLLIDTPRVVEIFADLTLRADGSVGSVTLLPGVPRTWQRYVTAALERWRFEPLPAGRVHRVQLVFGE